MDICSLNAVLILGGVNSNIVSWQVKMCIAGAESRANCTQIQTLVYICNNDVFICNPTITGDVIVFVMVS